MFIINSNTVLTALSLMPSFLLGLQLPIMSLVNTSLRAISATTPAWNHLILQDNYTNLLRYDFFGAPFNLSIANHTILYPSAMARTRLAAMFPSATSLDNYTVLYQDPKASSSQIRYGPFYSQPCEPNTGDLPCTPNWSISGPAAQTMGTGIIGGFGSSINTGSWISTSGGPSTGGIGGDSGDSGDDDGGSDDGGGDDGGGDGGGEKKKKRI